MITNRDPTLPKTYRDAFRATISLEFRFLWIDSLCIIQDDLEDWRMQSLKMGAIYSNARCNIAATWASDGGDGCFNKRDPFTVTPTTIELSLASGPSREFQISGKYTYDEDINDAPLNRRAWVVQERYLARKQLSFAKNQVYWECREVTASEQFPAGLSEHLLKESGKLKLQPPEAKPSLNFENVQEFRRGWCSLVETYSDCHLTRPSDKMIALAGLAGHSRDINGDTYLAGLWKTALLEQLCWRYTVDLYCPDDRQRNRSRTSSYYAPTWSWASFDGAVYTDNRYYREFSENNHFSEILNVRVDSENSSKLHSFVASELQMRGIMIWGRIVTIDSDELPDGGTSHEVLLTRQAKSVGASSLNGARINVFWDENVVSVEDDPPRWYRLQKERSSELLLIFVLESSDRWRVEQKWEFYDGLVLWEKHLPGRNPVFVRVGMFEYVIEFVEMLVAKLNLQPETALEGGLDLNDARLADIIEEVSII